MEDNKSINLQLIKCFEQLTVELQKMNASVGDKPSQILYTNKSILALLQINTTTLRKYRDEGLLGYSKIGGKYYYSTDDVNKFLKKNHFEPFAY